MKLSDIPPAEIASICVRSANSVRAHSYSGYHDITRLKSLHGATELTWDGVYGCYVMIDLTGAIATMMVYVNREPTNAD